MTAVPVLHRLRTLAIVAVVSGATLLTAACGGSDGDDAGGSGGSASAAEQTSGSGDDTGEDDGSDEGGSSATPDPCSLVTPADLQAAWGVEFNEGDASETTPPYTFHSCGFGQTSNEPPARTLTVQVLGSDDIDENLREQGQTPETVFEGQRDAATDPQPLELGDEAYQTDSHISILSGDLYVSIDAPGASSPEALQGLEQIAEVIAGNL
jgi:hypothetical protein